MTTTSKPKESAPQTKEISKQPPFFKALPKNVKVPVDDLKLRLDFHESSVVLHTYEKSQSSVKIVSAMDVAHALAKELSYGTGLLPENTLWWSNTSDGPVYALYEPPRVRLLALQVDYAKPPERYQIPLPGLIFLCSAGKPPFVYAVKHKPTKPQEIVFKAPLCNVFENGKTCPGNHKYPARIQDVIESFFTSFFSATADLRKRSQKFPDSVVELWKSLQGKTDYPLDDLVEHGTVQDLMQFNMKEY